MNKDTIGLSVAICVVVGIWTAKLTVMENKIKRLETNYSEQTELFVRLSNASLQSATLHSMARTNVDEIASRLSRLTSCVSNLVQRTQ